MQHLEHTLQVKSANIRNKKGDNRKIESDLNGDTRAANTKIPISYWRIVLELLNSYNSATPSFTLQDVLIGTDARETEIINEVS